MRSTSVVNMKDKYSVETIGATDKINWNTKSQLAMFSHEQERPLLSTEKHCDSKRI